MSVRSTGVLAGALVGLVSFGTAGAAHAGELNEFTSYAFTAEGEELSCSLSISSERTYDEEDDATHLAGATGLVNPTTQPDCREHLIGAGVSGTYRRSEGAEPESFFSQNDGTVARVQLDVNGLVERLEVQHFMVFSCDDPSGTCVFDQTSNPK